MSDHHVKLPVFLQNRLATRRGRILFLLGGLLLAALLFYVQIGDEFGPLLPGSSEIDALNRELKKVRAQELELSAQNEARERLRESVETRLGEAWLGAKHGEAGVELRAKLESAAKDLGLKLSSLGTVRTTKFSNELNFLELDLTMTAEIGRLTAFLAVIDDLEPKLYWRRMDFRPNPGGDGEVFWSGTLRCLSDERPQKTPSRKEKP